MHASAGETRKEIKDLVAGRNCLSMDPRRGRGGGKTVRSVFAKRWLILAALFVLYVLICATILCASRFFTVSRVDYSKYRNLDNISIALLELGLPLSSYALSLQRSYALSLRPATSPTTLAIARDDDDYDPLQTLAPIRSSGSGDNDSVEVVQDNHPLAFRSKGVAKVVDVKSSDNSEEINVPQGSEISIYSVKSSFTRKQQLWTLHNVCYNGSHLIRLQNESCREPEDAGRGGGLLSPIHCQQTELFSIRMASLDETRIPMAERPSSWIASRGNITRRTGTAAVVYLDRSTAEPWKFLQKVNMLLMMNNATVPAFVDRVDSFMFLKHRRVQKLFSRSGETNSSSFYRTYLSSILSMAHGTSAMEEMGHPFSGATEDNPICFDKVVVIGTMKGSSWPGGKIVAELVRNRLRQEFGFRITPRQSNDWPSLLCMFDNSTQGMSSTSGTDLLALLSKRSLGLDVSIVNFTTLDFREQFTALESADIVLGVYGADMVFPAMFSRENSVLIEIIPYKFLSRVHETQALDSGLIYVAHQCQARGLQDYLGLQNLTPAACMRNTECKHHYLNLTSVDFTNDDLQQIQKLLTLARLIISEVSAQSDSIEEGETPHSSFVVESLIGGRSKCRSFTRSRNSTCGSNWVSFTSDVDGPMTCCL